VRGLDLVGPAAGLDDGAGPGGLYGIIAAAKIEFSVVAENAKAGARSAQTTAIYFLLPLPAKPCFSSNLRATVDAPGRPPKINLATDAATTSSKNTTIEPARLL
jgi:hypothetical protein